MRKQCALVMIIVSALWASGGRAAGARLPGILHQGARLMASDGFVRDAFPSSAAVWDSTVVVGAAWDDSNGLKSGSAYVFEKPASGWSGIVNESAKLIASDVDQPQEFGSSVAIWGSTVLVGTENIEIGSAYAFERPAQGWSGTLRESARLMASDGVGFAAFGNTLALSGSTAVVGAWRASDDALYSGAAYVFKKPAGGWSGTLTENAKLRATDSEGDDYFGEAVAVAGSTVVIGASKAGRSGVARGGPRISDSLLRWDPDPVRGVWNAPQETEVPG